MEARERRPPVGTAARRAANHASPNAQNHRDGLERRPLVGTAARRAAACQTPTVGWLLPRRVPINSRMARDSGPRGPRNQARADREKARGRLGAPASGRHSGPQGRGVSDPNCGMAPSSARTPQQQNGARHRSAGLRPASRGSAKPAPMARSYANVSAAPSNPGWRDRCRVVAQRLGPRGPAPAQSGSKRPSTAVQPPSAKSTEPVT